MQTIFEVMKPVFQSVGVTPCGDWDATKRQIYGTARTQLAHDNLKPETRAKWQTLGRLTQLNPPAIVYRKE